MSLTLSFNKDDEKRITEMIEKVKERAKNGEARLWKLLAVWLHNATVRIFKQGGGVHGVPDWPPISPTMYGRRRAGTGGANMVYNESSNPLAATGGYRNSFQALRIEPDSLVYGSAYPKAEVIQYGGWNAANYAHTRGVPKRKALPDLEDEEVISQINEQFMKFLAYIIKGEGA